RVLFRSRFFQRLHGAEFQGGFEIARRKGGNRNNLEAWMHAAQFAYGLDPLHARHQNIGYDEIKIMVQLQTKALFSIFGGHHLMAMGMEDLPNYSLMDFIVFNYENPRHGKAYIRNSPDANGNF
ncbi:MAG: hypothetical protein VCD66_07200, partial [Alphaproteobacteria bacterium]